MGIEPTLSAWEAEVLPLNYTRLSARSYPGVRTSQSRDPVPPTARVGQGLGHGQNEFWGPFADFSYIEMGGVYLRRLRFAT